MLRSDEILEGDVNDGHDMISKDSQPMPTSYGYIDHSTERNQFMPISRDEMIAEMEAAGRRRIQEARETGLP